MQIFEENNSQIGEKLKRYRVESSKEKLDFEDAANSVYLQQETF